MQEERFTRIKSDAALPVQAARACLRQGGIAAGDLDAVVFYENPFAKLERVLLWLLRTFPLSYRQFPRAIADQLGSKLWVLDHLEVNDGEYKVMGLAAYGEPRKAVSRAAPDRAADRIDPAASDGGLSYVAPFVYTLL